MSRIRTSFVITKELRANLRVLAIKQNKSVGAVIRAAIKNHLIYYGLNPAKMPKMEVSIEYPDD